MAAGPRRGAGVARATHFSRRVRRTVRHSQIHPNRFSPLFAFWQNVILFVTACPATRSAPRSKTRRIPTGEVNINVHRVGEHSAISATPTAFAAGPYHLRTLVGGPLWPSTP